MRSLPVVIVAVVAACSHPDRGPDVPVSPPPPAPTHGPHTLTILGTNDLHGALTRLPLLAGFVANVRAARAADGGGVLLVDAGDLFQGTLESNLAEGADVVRAYNQLGYAASAVGNHEFDYGPEGPAMTAKSPTDDPRGALEARVHEATFPFLVTNILDDKTGALIAWPNISPSTIVEVAGTKVGLVGASTESTPFTTMPANFVGLRMAPAAPAIAAEAKALRDRGAQVVVVTAHLGSSCKDLDHPDDLSSCDRSDELFEVLDKVPAGLVDVFVAGHTHSGMAHHVGGVTVIESFSSGRAFGRVDLRIADGQVTDASVRAPQLLCPLDKNFNPVAVADCHPADYEGKPVVADPEVEKIVDAAVDRARPRQAEKLNVTLASVVTKSYGSESAEGNWITDLMLAARPDADLALTNGGGLRADLPAGELTYGRLFEAIPFDNRFAIVSVTGTHVRRLVTTNLQRGGGILSWGGLAVIARCKDGKLDVAIKVRGKPLVDASTYKIATSDFLASGGDGLFGRLKLPPGSFQTTDVIIRDAIADVLRAQKPVTVEPAQLLGPGARRLEFPGRRPVACNAATPSSPEESD
jgi:5'-nucleotidase